MSGSLPTSSYSLFSKTYFVTQGDFLKDPYKLQSLAIPGRLPECMDRMFIKELVDAIDPALSPLTKKRVVSLSEKIASTGFWKQKVDEKDELPSADLLQLAYSIDTALTYGRNCFSSGYISSKHLLAPFRLFVSYSSSSIIIIPKSRAAAITKGKDTIGRRALLLRQVKSLTKESIPLWETRELFHQKSKIVQPISGVVLDRTYQYGKSVPLPNWYASFIKNEKLHQLFDFYNGRLLSEIIRDVASDYSKMQRCAYEIVKSIKQLHDKGFVHNNLSPDNILITKEGSCEKVLFFGSRSSFSVQTEFEWKSISKNLCMRDIYALGCVLWVMQWKRDLPWSVSEKWKVADIAKINAFQNSVIRAKDTFYSKDGFNKDKTLIGNIGLALLAPNPEGSIVKLDKVIEALEEASPPAIRTRHS